MVENFCKNQYDNVGIYEHIVFSKSDLIFYNWLHDFHFHEICTNYTFFMDIQMLLKFVKWKFDLNICFCRWYYMCMEMARLENIEFLKKYVLWSISKFLKIKIFVVKDEWTSSQDCITVLNLVTATSLYWVFLSVNHNSILFYIKTDWQL